MLRGFPAVGSRETRAHPPLLSEPAPLTGEPTRITLSYMKGSISVRLDKDVERLLARAVRLSGRTQSEVIRDALRRQLAVDVFDQMRRRVAPFAEAQGLLTDEDVFKIVS
jgi:Arc/MetJ-type ribon-helix-helix transcriptional regulator